MRLDADHEVVFVAGQQPMYAGKLRYLADGTLRRRSEMEAPAGPERVGSNRWEWLGLSPRPSIATTVSDTPNAVALLGWQARAQDREHQPDHGE